MNIKKRGIYAIIGLLILVAGIFTIYAAVIKERGWHDSSDILVTVDGYNMTLQEAIYYNVFIDGANQSYTTEIPNPGHSADEIWVSVDGDEKTLQDAVSTTGLCGNSSNLYINSTGLGQFANEIEISPGTSLQDIIDNGEFCCVPNYGQSCPSGDPSCINAGTIVCDGTCTGSYKPAGTSCGTNKKCDGNGNCVATCQEGAYYDWPGQCIDFCVLNGCTDGEIFGNLGSSLRGCGICGGGSGSYGPYDGSASLCDYVDLYGGRVPICATECRCSS